MTLFDRLSDMRAQCFSWNDPLAVNEITPVFQDKCEPVNTKENGTYFLISTNLMH